MIEIHGYEFNGFTFPAGEDHIKIKKLTDTAVFEGVRITWEFEKTSEVFNLLLIVDALRRMGHIDIFLDMPYVPFARQDRVMVPCEPLSIKVFCDLINNCRFKEVSIYDPHSEVTTALLDNCRVVHQAEVFYREIKNKKDIYLICPDSGALKKIQRLSQKLSAQIIMCEKRRDVLTGEITGTIVYVDDVRGRECVIVDDICDGGLTFIEIAKRLKKKNAGKIVLCVTHGIFSKGLEVFDGLIDEIYTRKGKVK